MSLRLEVSNECEASIVDFNGVSARGTELLGGEAHELTVEDYVARRIAYNHLRVVRVVCGYCKVTTGNRGVELIGVSWVRPYFPIPIKWIIAWK